MKRNEYIKKHAVDGKWFLALKDIKSPLLLHSYRIEKETLRGEFDAFIAEPTHNPSVSYHRLDQRAVSEGRERLTALRERIVQEGQEKSIRDAYLDKIDQMLSELSLMQATIDGDWARFRDLNVELYGELETSVVADIKNALARKYPDLSSQEESDHTIEALRRSVTDEVVTRATSILKPYVLPVDRGLVYNDEEIVRVWDKALREVAPDWQCVRSEEVIHIKVNNRRRTIYVPAGIRIPGKKLARLFAHEAGVHVRRREQGKRSPLQLLSIGLRGYERAEEGLGLMHEQLIAGHFFNFGGQDKYLALMIATGALDGVAKDFKDTYRVLQGYFYRRKRKRLSEQKALELSQARAWRVTWRTFRGGDPSLPGCCFYKDKIYREGNIAMWQLFLEVPEVFSSAYAGKFDLASPEQRALVAEYPPATV